MSEIPENKSGQCEVCQQPAIHRCSACKLTFYCTPQHQKDHWKHHKSACRPYEVCVSQGLGRYLQASRDLKPGDLVLSETPVVFGPKPHVIEEGPVPCVGCCKLVNEENCTPCHECLWPACSAQCPGLKDNLRHGLECRVLKLLPATPSDSFHQFFRFDILIALRALFLQKTNKNKWELLLKLEDHLDKRGPGTDCFKTISEKVKHLEKYLRLLKDLDKPVFEQVSADLIHKIYAILDVNAMELMEEVDAEILYPTGSLIEHNCTPNTVQTIGDEQDGYRITFRAAMPIEKGAHITSIYTHILWGTQARRAHLKQSKYFSCECKRCRDPTELGTFFSALNCLGMENQPCGGVQLPVNPIEDKVKWVCNKCSIRLPNKEIMKFVEHLGGEVDKVLERKPAVTELEDLLEKLLKFLHPNHYHVYAVKHTLVQLYNARNSGGLELSNKFLGEKVEMCENLIEISRKIDPGCARLGLYLGVLYHELFEAKFTMLMRLDWDEEKSGLVEAIRGIVEENRRVLQYESQGKAGARLLQLAEDNATKFNRWMTDNNLL